MKRIISIATHLVLTVLVAVSITSCSNDDEQAVGESGGAESGQETSFTLTLSQPKTYATDGNATTDETRINTVDIFIEDDIPHGGTLNHVGLTINDFEETAVGSNEYTLKNKIKTTTGVKNILVAINFPADVVADMLLTKNIYAKRLVAQAEDLKLPAYGFAMSNPNTSIVFEADKENKVAFSVSRLLSKIIVKEGSLLDRDVEDGSGTIENIEFAENAEAAVPVAYRLSAPGDGILLSPANASWDQYPNFEVRGDKFIEAVESLTGQKEE